MSMWCPACGAEYVDGVWACADDHTTLVAEKPARPSARDLAGEHPFRDLRLALLGSFDPLEVPILLELLESEGIAAVRKNDNDVGWRTGHYGLKTGAWEVLVDAARRGDAERLVRDRLPAILAELRRSLQEQQPQ